MVESGHTNTGPRVVSVDTGGTFTDIVVRDEAGEHHACKVLSSGSVRGVVESVDENTLQLLEPLQPGMSFNGFSIRRLGHDHGVDILETDDAGRVLEVDQGHGLVPGDVVDMVTGEPAAVLGVRLATGTPRSMPMPDVQLRLGTTRGTNALLERRTDPVVFVVTRGFADLLHIGTQQRPDIFALPVLLPEPIHSQVIEVDERIDASGSVISELDEAGLRHAARAVRETGIEAAAVAFLHAWREPCHEERAAAILRECGFRHVSTSAALTPVIRILPRAQAAVVDAALQEPVGTYIRSVGDGLESGRGHKQPGDVLVMTSSGGLVASGSYHPRDSLLSGPAGGVAGAASIGRAWGFQRVLTFDMGGTSTDVSRWDNGSTYRFEQSIGSVQLSTAALDIHTVAAGGGSICSLVDGHLEVGPRSGGADPGPACYGHGGPLCITDINLLSGRLDARRFGIPIDTRASEAALAPIVEGLGAGTDSDLVLDRLLARANRCMADAVKQISLRRGCDPRDFALVAFGGAGPQHACAVAGALSIKSVLLPGLASVLSAVGLAQASIERFAHEQVLQLLDEVEPGLPEIIERLRVQATDEVIASGAHAGDIELRRVIVRLSLLGQDSPLDVEWSPGIDLRAGFTERFQAMYGYEPPDRAVEVESVRVLASTSLQEVVRVPLPDRCRFDGPRHTIRARFAGRWMEIPSIEREAISTGHEIEGPAIVTDRMTTAVIEPGWSAVMGEDGTLLLEQVLEGNEAGANAPVDEEAEAERFADAFTAIAREMGEVLDRCAISVNVKERRDYSCTLLDARGRLVVNAPHLPVHLGSMGSCVQEVTAALELLPGDVALTNHPRFGGSHLPDLTVITPVYDDQEVLLGHVASRAHHAELGGSRPGSMPPAATRLVDEAVVIDPMKIVEAGRSRMDELKQSLLAPPWPTRCVEDNLADVRAAIAANQRGVEALRSLARESGSSAVQAGMERLQHWAESLARDALRSLPDGRSEAVELMDDGTRLVVSFEIAGDEATIDFTGTDDVHPGNLNATTAIVRSVVLYVLRLLVGRRLPLNDGIMEPVTLVIPRGMLNPTWEEDPARCPAVVGGNVETSQRLVDTLLKALGISAAGQGTMNNTLFGNEHFGYYETLGGGCGAMEGTDGASGVHCHMSNTRITDPEILEQRYPVRLERFALRRGSGGAGRFTGGEGLERVIRFLSPVQLSMLTQHRVAGPFGAAGGSDGLPGEQQVHRVDGGIETLASSDQRDLVPGEALVVRTPGGGGWGEP